MAICPLCENEQASGASCEVCGRPFTAGSVAGHPTPPVEGLEPTLFQAVQAVDLARLEGLEPTLLEPPAVEHSAALDGGGEDAGWVDRTAHEPAHAADVEPIDVEVTALAAEERAPPDPFAPVVCRYCRRPAAPGDVFCACGVKLEVYRPGAPPLLDT